jgi:hypothetical protein
VKEESVRNVYFDDDKYQKRAGMCADAMREALKNDVHPVLL